MSADPNRLTRPLRAREQEALEIITAAGEVGISRANVAKAMGLRAGGVQNYCYILRERGLIYPSSTGAHSRWAATHFRPRLQGPPKPVMVVLPFWRAPDLASYLPRDVPDVFREAA